MHTPGGGEALWTGPLIAKESSNLWGSGGEMVVERFSSKNMRKGGNMY